jgi:hypothetical protein
VKSDGLMEGIEKKISQLPPDLQREIGDFIDFLLLKAQQSVTSTSSRKNDVKLPQMVPDEDTLLQRFHGQNIAICDDKIIAADLSLKNLHVKLKGKVPAGKSCHIRYIDAGISFYGLDLQA